MLAFFFMCLAIGAALGCVYYAAQARRMRKHVCDPRPIVTVKQVPKGIASDLSRRERREAERAARRAH